MFYKKVPRDRTAAMMKEAARVTSHRRRILQAGFFLYSYTYTVKDTHTITCMSAFQP